MTFPFELEPISLSSGQMIMKRALDLVVSIIALGLTLPIMIVVAILIKITSRGQFSHPGAYGPQWQEIYCLQISEP